MTQRQRTRRLSLPRLKSPRLLPITIVVMAALLVVKSGAMVQAASNGIAVPAAKAAEAPKPVAPKPLSAPPDARLAEAAIPTPPGPPSGPPAPPPVSDSERQLLADLRQRRVALDNREAALAAREATLAAVDRRLAARVAELTALQNRLEALERDRKARDETNWAGLVKVYESMKPRDAAVIFNDLDLAVLLPVVDRMKEAKAAPIIAAMLPDRARQLTADLAQMRVKSNSLDGKAGAGG
jgi:flagellar motility protein MotE (MotC chaperone)